MTILRVGHLVLATVVKAYPNEAARLLLIQPDGPLALLSHDEADRPYRVGDSFFAVVAEVRAPYPRLTQRTVHYVRRIAEMALSTLIAERRLAIVRVTYRRDAPFCKVLVRLASPGVLPEAVCLIQGCRADLTASIILVAEDEDLDRRVRAALWPAPPRAIEEVRSEPDSRTVWIRVASGWRGRVLGPRGLNLRMAGRLLRRDLRLEEGRPAPEGVGVGTRLSLWRAQSHHVELGSTEQYTQPDKGDDHGKTCEADR